MHRRKRGLAGTRWADDADDLARHHVESDILERPHQSEELPDPHRRDERLHRVALDVKPRPKRVLEHRLEHRQHRDHDEIPEGGDHQQLDDLGVGVIDILGIAQDVAEADDAGERGDLDEGDELVAERRHHDPHCLRQNDAAQRQPVGHADRLRRLVLAVIDGQQPGAHDLRNIGAFIQSETEKCRDRRRDDIDGADVEQTRYGDMGKDQRQIEPDQQLQNDRRAAEEPGVERGRRSAAPDWASHARRRTARR